MNDQKRLFLGMLSHPPARLTAEETAWALSFQPHDIPVLVRQRLLRPLGDPRQNCVKYFCTAEILELSRDRNWLSRATNAIHGHWRTKNGSTGGKEGS